MVKCRSEVVHDVGDQQSGALRRRLTDDSPRENDLSRGRWAGEGGSPDPGPKRRRSPRRQALHPRRWAAVRGFRLALVPAGEEGPTKRATEQHEHQPGGCRSPVNLDPLGTKGEDREDVAMPAGARRGPGADVARRPGVVRELEGPAAGLCRTRRRRQWAAR